MSETMMKVRIRIDYEYDCATGSAEHWLFGALPFKDFEGIERVAKMTEAVSAQMVRGLIHAHHGGFVYREVAEMLAEEHSDAEG